MAEKFAYQLLIGTRKKKWANAVDIEKVELELTGLGLEGWEMVGVFKQTNSSGLEDTVFVMKRLLPPNEYQNTTT